MNYAFSLDASACTGCKACQEACKDKNGLPEGMLWRRVIEVSGGEWRKRGSAWENSVFAYHLSLSCNHCTHPKCAGVCPTDAFTVRPDGIVLLDAARCMGCGYCAWACPYGAPQLDGKRGVMTKCDFCYDNLDAGLPPTCVAACPLRVLNIVSTGDFSPVKGSQYLWLLPASEHPFPLPNYSRTEPHLVIKPHPQISLSLEKAVSNQEEILPPRSFDPFNEKPGRHERPLVAFTLLTQMAAGMAMWGFVVHYLPLRILLEIGILLAAGGIISFLHLGRKRNAWRAVVHLRKSWLSREILLAGLFSFSWLATVAWAWAHGRYPAAWPMAVLGIGLVYSMSRVYRLRAVPPWNTWRTQAAFFLSTILLGMLGVRLFIGVPGWAWVVGLTLAGELGLTLTKKKSAGDLTGRVRVVLSGLAIMGVLVATILPRATVEWIVPLVFILALVEEILGRLEFYSERLPYPVRAD